MGFRCPDFGTLFCDAERSRSGCSRGCRPRLTTAAAIFARVEARLLRQTQHRFRSARIDAIRER
jgi:hypothetical protein